MSKIKIAEYELVDQWENDTGVTCLKVSASRFGNPVPLDEVPGHVVDEAVAFFVGGAS